MTDGGEIPITYSQLAGAFKSLGVGPGRVLMLHASIRSVGKVMGGPNVIIQALLDTLTPAGTLMMYVGWEDIPDFVSDLPEAARQAYLADHPPFDPRIARAVRDHGILAEVLRTWPGAHRSDNPEASMVAVGAQAQWITRDHPMDYGYGPGSPLDKLVGVNGQVLMLGAPLDTITLLHYAENRARLRNKAIVRYQCPIVRDGKKEWIAVEDFNTGVPHDNYTFEGIAREYVALGKGRQGQVGHAPSYLFDAADLTAFAITWLEERFGASAL